MMMRSCLFFLAISSMVSASRAETIRWEEGVGGNGHYYTAVVLAKRISWTDAKAQAEVMGGYLATITSAAESDFVFENLVNNSSLFLGGGGSGPWLGGYQDFAAPDYSEPSGGWRWVTGEEWNYTNWGLNEPSDKDGVEHFLQYTGAGYGSPQPFWNDQRDSTALPYQRVISYVVERELPGDLNADGLVNSRDLDIVRAWWGTEAEPFEFDHGDATGDGLVNSRDLDLIRSNWGATAAAAVPEPGVLVLSIGGAVLLAWRRSHRRFP